MENAWNAVRRNFLSVEEGGKFNLWWRHKETCRTLQLIENPAAVLLQTLLSSTAPHSRQTLPSLSLSHPPCGYEISPLAPPTTTQPPSSYTDSVGRRPQKAKRPRLPVISQTAAQVCEKKDFFFI